MAINYRLVRGRNPFTGTNGFKAQPVVTQRVDRHQLVRSISSKTTVSSGDVAAVLAELADLLARELASGNPVTLDGIGTFYVSMRSKLVSDVNLFQPKRDLKRAVIRMRVAPQLKQQELMFIFQLFDGQPGRAEALPPAPSSDGEEVPPDTEVA